MCLEKDNLTMLSDPDSQGNVYTASFELFPFHEGASYSFFMSIMNGNGPSRGHFCVIKAIVDRFGTARDWTHVIQRARETQRLADEFNKYLGYVAMIVQVPTLAQVETVSDFACLFRILRPHYKYLKPGESVTIELFLEETFQNFDLGCSISSVHRKSCALDCIGNDGISICGAAGSESCVLPQQMTNLAQAFSHFSWHFTKNLVIFGLQGVSNGILCTLTNQTIHSMSCQFGDSDGSTSAIAEFFSSHQ